MELLKKLYCISSKSNHEEKILEFLIDWLFANIPDGEVEIDKTGNLYVTKGKSATYPCIVAHVDQVQTNHSFDFQTIETEDVIFGFSLQNKRFEGLGADDKNGVWVCLKCLLKYDVLKCALFVGEEIGCVGSSKADMDFFKDCRFVLQCDRRGNDDFITEASLTELCSEEFFNEIKPEIFGYTKSYGMMTDVMTLKENGLNVCCANISCGYYEPHTDREFTIKKDLLNCLSLVEYIIENLTGVYPHEYVYKPKTHYSGYGYGYYDKNGLWHSSYNGYQSNNVSNSTAKKEAKECVAVTTPKVEETKTESKVEEFFDTSADDDDNQKDWIDDFLEEDVEEHDINFDEDNNIVLNEEMRDEIYDVIYVLLNDCPNASYDMIRSALLNTYPNLSEKDMYSLYGEVKYDMKKYFSMPCV